MRWEVLITEKAFEDDETLHVNIKADIFFWHSWKQT